MKAKKIVPEKSEQPKPLPAPSNEISEDQLAPWQKEIVALAKARLSIDGKDDVLSVMHRRAIALSRIMEDMATGEHESEASWDAIVSVMRIIEEYIWVAKLISHDMNPRTLFY